MLVTQEEGRSIRMITIDPSQCKGLFLARTVSLSTVSSMDELLLLLFRIFRRGRSFVGEVLDCESSGDGFKSRMSPLSVLLAEMAQRYSSALVMRHLGVQVSLSAPRISNPLRLVKTRELRLPLYAHQ